VLADDLSIRVANLPLSSLRLVLWLNETNLPAL
jgi:hypothetical protein